MSEVVTADVSMIPTMDAGADRDSVIEGGTEHLFAPEATVALADVLPSLGSEPVAMQVG